MSNTFNIIHLSRREDRLKSLQKECSDQKVEYKLWEGIEKKHNRKLGIHLAHKQIVQYAKDNNLPYVTCGEDDIYFLVPGAWDYYITNIPEDFDIYYGGLMVGEVKDNRIASISSGMTLYTVHSRFYDTFLSINPDTHIDREISKDWEKYKLMVCPKFVCSQIMSKSDNNFHTTDFSPLLAGRPLFGR